MAFILAIALKCYNFPMKIMCDKCGKDITAHIYQEMERNTPKSIICPICNTEQKRYLSEADFQIYLSFMEATYFLLSFITAILLSVLGFNLYFGIIFIILFAGAILVTNKFKFAIYKNGIFKQETMYITQKEDSKAISKSLRWQFILFFALVITFVTEFDKPNLFWAFVGLSLVALGASILKTRLAINKEKQTYLKH